MSRESVAPESAQEFFRDHYDRRATGLDTRALRGPDVYGSALLPAVLRAPYRYWEQLIAGSADAEKSLLDFGCGQGRFSVFPARRGFGRVVGIDISAASLEVARERARYFGIEARAEFVAGDCEQLPFADGEFDVVIESGTLPCLDLERALAEIRRVLRPGGRFLLVDTLGHNPVLNLRRRFAVATGERPEFVVSHILRVEQFEIFRRHFDNVGARFFNFATLLATPVARWAAGRALLRGLESVDATLLRALPFLRRYAFKVVLELDRPAVPPPANR